ncbi:MAG TPA: hypothetical protein VHT23_06625 [Gemmatimonadaceae bacterium]|jgi:hypothetical protein|nr:hypothetical protein [Gemmatimonadaceae bacterium]
MRMVLLVGLVAALATSCTPPTTARSSRDPNVITSDELVASQATNAFDAIRRLRPNFLTSRGVTTLRGADTGYPRVYLDRVLFGDLNSLKNLSVNGIREIHYYNGPEASGRFGLDNVSGAIEVISAAR